MRISKSSKTDVKASAEPNAPDAKKSKLVHEIIKRAEEIRDYFQSHNNNLNRRQGQLLDDLSDGIDSQSISAIREAVENLKYNSKNMRSGQYDLVIDLYNDFNLAGGKFEGMGYPEADDIDACDDVKASKKVCASFGSKVVYDKDGIKVTETGRDYDFIATVENTTDEDYLVEGSGFEEFTVPAHDWVGLLADEDGYATLNYFKWMDVPPLTKEQVKDLWDKTSLFIDWGDGTDSMCQENDYTLEEILEAMDHGGKVYVDEDPAEVNACGDIKASKKVSADDKALQHIKAAIDILGKSGKKDDITKDSIANLATVMFDIKGRK